jgi:hypothetical protein
MIPTFRKGSWIEYSVPQDVARHWNKVMKLQAASIYATAVSKGISPSQSAVLAECYVNKQMYPGLQYNKSIEDQLQSFQV